MRMVKTIYLTCLEMKNFDIQRADEIFMGSNSWSQVYKMASKQNELRHEEKKIDNHRRPATTRAL